ncbi:hypothetical protein [Natrinema pallidum]|uniref:Uncharacterized protein n=1 Tax=Natrinema pallidum TaxID=69527 RepID=A0A4P9TMH0_9EURY|nr:hypothetical protein [Natrinema pallidum]QCW05260.1 hypothetical protein FGF80_18615 [Natrinema pallidum]
MATEPVTEPNAEDLPATWKLVAGLSVGAVVLIAVGIQSLEAFVQTTVPPYPNPESYPDTIAGANAQFQDQALFLQGLVVQCTRLVVAVAGVGFGVYALLGALAFAFEGPLATLDTYRLETRWGHVSLATLASLMTLFGLASAGVWYWYDYGPLEAVVQTGRGLVGLVVLFLSLLVWLWVLERFDRVSGGRLLDHDE